MPRDWSARFLAMLATVVIVCAGSVAGCGGGAENTGPMKEEDTPAAKGKDSMDYFRNNMMKKQGASK